MIKTILTEAKSISDEYLSKYSDIPEEIFNKIILMDPQTSLDKNIMGPNAKQLLLPKYLSGEVAFVEHADEVKQAIEQFINNRAKYEIKNIALYPSVELFVRHINDPENNPVTQAVVQEKSKIDQIYDKYYATIAKDDFNYIITLDPETNIEKGIIGYFAKNLFLRLYLKGEKRIADRSLKNTITDNITYIQDNLDDLGDKFVHINQLDDFDDFLNVQKIAIKDSDHLTFLKNSPYWSRIRYIGSTKVFDVFEPLDYRAAAAIAGASGEERINGRRGPGIGERGSQCYTENLLGHWCTTNAGYWNSYNKQGQKYYNFISRNDPTRDNRKHNYQLAIKPDGSIGSNGVADGVEDYTHPNLVRPRLFSEDPDLTALLATEKDYAGNLKEVTTYKTQILIKDKYTTYTYKDATSFMLDCTEVVAEYDVELLPLIEHLIIGAAVENIPANSFNGGVFTDVTFEPGSLKSIGAMAFKNCTNLQLLRLPESLETIGPEAFANCTSLHGTTTIYNNVKSIGAHAFYDTKITLSILSDREEGSLKISALDEPWFVRHSKLVNVLQEDFINEDFINEDIPKILARAYEEAHMHFYKNFDANILDRGETNIDFYNSTYTEMTPEEAIIYIRENTTNINNLRIVYGGDLVIFRYNGHRAYAYVAPDGVTVPLSAGTKLIKKIESQRDLFEFLRMTDKIYKADEKPISDDIAAKRARNKQFTNNLLSARTAKHAAAARIRNNNSNSFSNFNVGSIGTPDNTPDDIKVKILDKEYLINKGEIFDAGMFVTDTGYHRSTQVTINTIKRMYQYVKDNKNFYTSEIYEKLTQSLLQGLRELERSYAAFGEIIASEKMAKIVAKWVATQRLIAQQKLNIQTQQQAIRNLNSIDIKNDPKYREISGEVSSIINDIKEAKADIINMQRDLEIKKQEIQDMIAAMEKKEQKLSADSDTYTKKVAQLDKSISDWAEDNAQKIEDTNKEIIESQNILDQLLNKKTNTISSKEMPDTLKAKFNKKD